MRITNNRDFCSRHSVPLTLPAKLVIVVLVAMVNPLFAPYIIYLSIRVVRQWRRGHFRRSLETTNVAACLALAGLLGMATGIVAVHISHLPVNGVVTISGACPTNGGFTGVNTKIMSLIETSTQLTVFITGSTSQQPRLHNSGVGTKITSPIETSTQLNVLIAGSTSEQPRLHDINFRPETDIVERNETVIRYRLPNSTEIFDFDCNTYNLCKKR